MKNGKVKITWGENYADYSFEKINLFLLENYNKTLLSDSELVYILCLNIYCLQKESDKNPFDLPIGHSKYAQKKHLAALQRKGLLRVLKQKETENIILDFSPITENILSQRQKGKRKRIKIKKSEIAERIKDIYYPQLMLDLIEQIGKKNKSGKLTTNRQLNGFIIPMIELQKQFDTKNSGLTQYVLKQAILHRANTINYIRTVFENNKHKFIVKSNIKSKKDWEKYQPDKKYAHLYK